MSIDEEVKEETSKMLEILIAKIDELTKVIKEEKKLTKDDTSETSKEELLETLTTKIDKLAKEIKDEKKLTEDKIKEHPLAYVIGAFVGGVTVGLLIEKGKEGK